MEKEIGYLVDLLETKENEIEKLRAAIELLKGIDNNVDAEPKAAPVVKPKRATAAKPKRATRTKAKRTAAAKPMTASAAKPKTTPVAKPKKAVATKAAKSTKPKAAKKRTVKDLVLLSLKDGRPKTKLEILSVVKKSKGASYQGSSLSPQLSSMMKTHLQKTNIAGENTSNQFYYGLNDWFVEGKLMDKYVDTVTAK